MKKVINGKTYNTDTAELIGDWHNGYPRNDFRTCSEELFKTSKGAYFIAGNGGAMTEWGEPCGGTARCGGSGIRPIDEAEALEWAEQHLDAEEVEKYFGHLITEA
jgi:hypothetical protein